MEGDLKHCLSGGLIAGALVFRRYLIGLAVASAASDSESEIRQRDESQALL